MRPAVIEIDMTGEPGRLLVAADVHGAFPLLDTALAALQYDPTRDTVVIIGDLVDRGDASHRCLEWTGGGRRHALRGNHEAYIEGVCDGRIAVSDHVEDGGGWFHELADEDRVRYRRTLGSLPLAAHAITPRGRRVGMIHADLEGSHFGHFCSYLRAGDHRAAQVAMNGRSRMTAVRSGTAVAPVADVDHMFFGHVPVGEPLTVGNCSWIDVGLPDAGSAMVIDVDLWMDRTQRGGCR